MPPSPSVTVIVPVRNEARSIDATLRSLLEQDFPRGRYDVVVADGGSTDDTVVRVRALQGQYPNLRLTYNAARWSSGGRNLGVRHMTGDVAVIVDGHCVVPDRHYLSNLVGAFASSGADCLGRPQPLDAPAPTDFQRAVAIARSSRLGHNPDSDIYSDVAKFVPPQSTAVAYRRTVFHRVGPFDGRFDACEDVEFNQRVHDAGLTCYFSPAVKIVYHPRGTWRGLFTQLARYGAGRARLFKKLPRSLTVPAVVPPLALLGLVFGLPASLLIPGVAPWYATAILAYGILLAAATAWLGRGQPAHVWRTLPPVFAGIHFGFAYGFLRELFAVRR